MVVLVPINDISAKRHLMRSFSGDSFDVFETSTGYQPNEDFTFTFRLSLDLASAEGREEAVRIRRELLELGYADNRVEEMKHLIALLDEYEWDVSFLAFYPRPRTRRKLSHSSVKGSTRWSPVPPTTSTGAALRSKPSS
jgi:hypothetical protein